MLVICNGAVKSGSTWLYNILDSLMDFERPPERYLTESSQKRKRNPCIQPQLLSQFVATEDVRQKNYLSKNHIGNPLYRDQLRANANVIVFDIQRDVRDMVVSAYYDECNRNGYKGEFSEYYWNSGRYLADEVNRYHAMWEGNMDRFCMVSYEKLHTDFSTEVERIAVSLGIKVDAQTIEAVREKTSITSLRNRYQDEALYEGSNFFRKGVIGDWGNHFDSAMIADIERVQRSGIGVFDRRALLRKIRRLSSKWS